MTHPTASQPPPAAAPKVETPVKTQQPASPVSPGNIAREQERMSTIFEINTLLLKEVVDLQNQGKAGQVGPTPDTKPGEKPAASKEYVE